MGTLLLKCAGPLQSWGVESRFTERKTRHEPTKSGIVGLLAAALGRKREETIDDLSSLVVCVRTDQPGRVLRDFQTAHTQKFDRAAERWVDDKSLPLSQRFYLADAVFVVAVGVPDSQLPSLADAVDHPAFPLYLGRRSCSPSCRMLLEAREGADPVATLSRWPWEASDRLLIGEHRANKFVRLSITRDSCDDDGDKAHESVRDVPVSFSQLHRRYEWRMVVRDQILVPNPHCVLDELPQHDPLAALEEVR